MCTETVWPHLVPSPQSVQNLDWTNHYPTDIKY